MLDKEQVLRLAVCAHVKKGLVKHNLLGGKCSVLLLYLFTYTDSNKSESTSLNWEVYVCACMHVCTHNWCLE
jgi:hypothetical protein